uniref:claudin-7-like n=1 Tax=Styela clava TaxID=7725 RepID=UPI00193933E1|nr:claudin-7-like [Styela clava]
MSLLLEVSCPFMILFGLILTINVFQSNEWEQTDMSTIFSQANWMNGGIWERCMNYANSGTVTCSGFDNFFLGLPLHIQAARAFSISSLVFGAAGTLLSIFAVAFCPCASQTAEYRVRVRLIGGICGIIGGLSIVAGVSWFASSVMNTYYNSMMISPDSERLAFGNAIFIGWAAGAISLVGGLIAVCMWCAFSDHQEESLISRKEVRHLKSYQPPQAQEYV